VTTLTMKELLLLPPPRLRPQLQFQTHTLNMVKRLLPTLTRRTGRHLRVISTTSHLLSYQSMTPTGAASPALTGRMSKTPATTTRTNWQTATDQISRRRGKNMRNSTKKFMVATVTKLITHWQVSLNLWSGVAIEAFVAVLSWF
jgi:hypothetical protein